MKKTVDILGLPVISITEGRELGTSKTLLIDARQGSVAAITIEDDDWYRGVKLIPYDSVIAIGDDAVTVSNSENILTLEAAGDFETLLDENIRVIGTKAITRTGTIQGTITELFIGDDGKIEKCEITTPEGSTSEVTAEQISIFGKQVTVIDASGDGEKKNNPIAASPTPAAPIVEEPPAADKSAQSIAETPTLEEPLPVEEEEPATEEPAAEIPAAEPAAEPEPTAEYTVPESNASDSANEDRHRRFLLGKKASRTIKMDNGIVIVEAGAEITEEVLQKAKLANKFIELSMSAQ